MRREVGVTAPYRKVGKPTWRDAAIRLGEELASVGPDGYYDMTPKEWLDWAMKQVKKKKVSNPT